MEELKKSIIESASLCLGQIGITSTTNNDAINAGTVKTLCEALQIVEAIESKQELEKTLLLKKEEDK